MAIESAGPLDRPELPGPAPAAGGLRLAHAVHGGQCLPRLSGHHEVVPGRAPGRCRASWAATPISKSRPRRSGWRSSLDGLDGRIARLTGTTSDFGREMDSLADVISFGVAPAVLALAWGAQFVDGSVESRSPGVPAPRGLLHRLPLSAVRRGAAGAFQRPEEPRAQESRTSRTASTSSGCRSRRRRAWWPPWSTPATRRPSSSGRCRSPGWRCWRCWHS